MTKTAEPKVSKHNYFSMAVLNNPDRFVKDARKSILASGIDFDTFVVRGMSGAIAGGMLARSLNKHLYVVRKPNDGSHDNTKAFGNTGSRWLFLDDFVSSGATFWATYDVVQETLGTRFGYHPETGVWDALPCPEEVPEFMGAYLFLDYKTFAKSEFQSHLIQRSEWNWNEGLATRAKNEL